MKKLKFARAICLYALAYLAYLLSPTLAHAQSEIPTPDKKWELGLRIDNLQYGHLESDNTTLYLERRLAGIHLDVFVLRNLKGGKFLRGALGLAYIHSEETVIRSYPPIQGTYRASTAWTLNSEIAVGYQFPESGHHLLNRLRFRLGLVLEHTNSLYEENSSYLTEYDSLGGSTTDLQSLTNHTFLQLHPAIFFQFEVRIVQQLHLGLEWRQGPYISFNRTRMEDEDGSNVRTQVYTKVSWFSRLFTPLFSIGYSF